MLLVFPWPGAYPSPPTERRGRGRARVRGCRRRRRPGQRLAGDDRLTWAIQREPVAEELEAVEIPRRLGGRPEGDGDEVDAVPAPGGDEDVTGVERVSGFDPVDPRHPQHQIVAVDDPADLGAAAQRRPRRVDDPPKSRLAKQNRGELREICRGRVVARGVEADGCRVMAVI